MGVCLTHVESTPLDATMELSKAHGPQQQGAALMTRTIKYVALDVHQATTLASVPTDDTWEWDGRQWREVHP